MQKIERMMAIVLALNKKEKLTAEELAGIFEVNVRTIYRDIQALCEMEIPIAAALGSNGGYSIMDGYFIPPIIFTRDEVLALLLSEKIISIVDLPGYTQYINTSFLKIKSLVDDKLREQLEKLEQRTIFDISFEYPDIPDPRIFGIIEKGIVNNNIIDIEYDTSCDMQNSQCRIKPYVLIFDHGAWDLVAYDESADEERVFKLEKIKEAVLTNCIFTLPDGFIAASYYNCHNYSDIYQRGDRCKVRLRLDKAVYTNIKDLVYFKDAIVYVEESGFFLEILTKKPEDYIWLSLQYAGNLTILEPQWLIDELGERIKKIKKLYI